MTKIMGVFLFLSLCVAMPLAAQADAKSDSELVYRASLGRADDIQLLIKKQGASPNAKNDSGVPVLALAAARQDKEGINVLNMLLAAGADINATDSDGQSALFYAAKNGNMDAVKALLAHGINYYAADSDGDIARTIAHNAGHDDIVKAMDDFVTGQTKTVEDKYKAYNDTVKQRIEEMKQSASSSAKAAVSPSSSSSLSSVSSSSSASSQSLTSEEAADLVTEAEEKAMREHRRAMEPLFTRLAFESCKLEYWYYCSETRQSTELSDDKLNAAIVSGKDDIEDLEDQLVAKYHAGRYRVDRVSELAKRRIFHELDSMPSHIFRHENGVGKVDDMQTRCATAARDWDMEPTGAPSVPPPPPPGRNNVIGNVTVTIPPAPASPSPPYIPIPPVHVPKSGSVGSAPSGTAP